MHTMHLSGANLNDLVALHALTQTRSVTLAARRVGLSQSAMSHALARLRATFADPLFTRGPGGLVPTPVCRRLAPRLESALADIESVLNARERFDPETSQRTFRIASSDAFVVLGLDRLLADLRTRAPGVGLALVDVDARDQDALTSGRIDLLIGGPGDKPRGPIKQRVLFEEPFVIAARRRHPLLARSLSKTAYAAAAHVVVSRDERPTFVDEALRRHGLKRTVAMRVPDFGMLGELIERTDLVATVPTSVAAWYASRWAVSSRKAPVVLPAFSPRLYTHARAEGDEAIAWLVERLVSARASLASK